MAVLSAGAGVGYKSVATDVVYNYISYLLNNQPESYYAINNFSSTYAQVTEHTPWTPTGFTYTDYYGTGFTWDYNIGKPSAGVITEIHQWFKNYSVSGWKDYNFHLTGINADIANLQTLEDAVNKDYLLSYVFAGDDSFIGGNSQDNVNGYGGNDYFVGGGGYDYMYGGDGNDSIVYGDNGYVSDNNDYIDGGNGVDTLLVKSLQDGVYIDLSNATDQVLNDGYPSVVINMENVDASGSANAVTILGDAGANLIVGSSFADSLVGGGGADSILAGDGDDSVVYDSSAVVEDGGAGSNTLVLNGVVSVDLANTLDQVSGGGVTINFSNVDASNLSSAITLTGDDGNNILIGGSGNDQIDGGLGDDQLYGGAGNDRIVYDISDSVQDGGGGANTLVLSSTEFVILYNVDDQVLDGGVTTNFANVDASGSAAGVYVIGSDGANIINGSASDDWIDGYLGADKLYGGSGNDSIVYDSTDSISNGGSGDNTLVLNYAAVVSLSNTSDQVKGGGVTTGFVHVDASASAQAVTLSGSATYNSLVGGTGNDSINGQAGDDTLIGGLGKDTLTGGTGNDVFVFYSAGDGIDTIKDFNKSLDIIDVSYAIDGWSGNISDYLKLTTSGGSTTLWVDHDGLGAAESFVKLTVLSGVTGLNLSSLVSTGHLDVII